MKKTKFIVAFLLVCVLSIGGAVVVFAGTFYEDEYMDLYIGDSTYTAPKVIGNYLFVKYGATGICYMFDSPSVVEVRKSDHGNSVVVGFKSMYQKAGEKWSVIQGSNTSLDLQSALSLYACNVDLKDSNGTVVFLKTEVPIVAPARQLPAMVLPGIRKTVIVGIGGLALVIGFLILPKKLLLYLRV